MEEGGISPQSNEMTVAVNGVVLSVTSEWGDITEEGISPLVSERRGDMG